MRMSEFMPLDQIFAHSDCAKCGVPMWLAQIEPRVAGQHLRTFECHACGNTTTEIVRYQ
jgi:hypothetical protein